MATPLAQKLIKRINEGQRIGIDTLMRTALLDPEHGYYTTQKVFGAEGDFVTAPEISQIFGEVISAYIAVNIGGAGYTSATLVELGPGKGTLMCDMLRGLNAMPNTHQPTEVVMVEASDKLAKAQQEKLAEYPNTIRWAKDISELPKAPCFIVANEFFDALPIQQFIYESGEWKERVVNASEDALSFITAPATDLPNRIQGVSPSDLFEGANNDKVIELDPNQKPQDQGQIHEYSSESERTMRQLSGHIKTYGGMLIAIDYGYMQHAFGDSLQALKKHKFVNVLEHVGEVDITAHVNFAHLKETAEAAGLTTHLLTTQGKFLRVLGAQMRATSLCHDADKDTRVDILSGLERLISPQLMGDLFKVLVVAHPDLDVLDIGA